MKTVRYTIDAARDLKRYGNMADRIRQAVTEYAAGDGAHANNVTQLVISADKRLRIGNFRVIFREEETELTVVKIAPRSNAYD
jgi:mRNA interferase RelE/StbE